MDNEISNKQISIEIIYALETEQKLFNLTIETTTNVEQAIKQSNILQHYPEIILTINKVGIFNKVCKLTDKLQDGDRIEIYRPLIADPKETRKKRALKQK